MDRRRAAGALLALAACIASSAAAPTASNQTALDLYEGSSEGCYYNFQHYGEGDRIMTNEPCLNCTCHNRMLMCYLRVCPFTKAIGQDCTVEKRADQCCPIVTCPDVPVDLLTSTSTTSPAEYGATGLGKLDKYGCSISGKYFPEGSKVPPTPNKPCEHCYCIRNMTTCVMQECTLHVDGCTPIYHKDVCCPVRYSCDHPEDEVPLLDDMSTTVRPTPGFLLTTTTVSPVTQMSQDCVHDDQIFADGALIKTEKACEHCYCMKGDIVCVVQECGAPMENEGKNCTSLPPREGQCCPDTYICEGDELSSDVTTESTTDSLIEKITTLLPPRRGGVEGSGYRNEPDEAPYTAMPTIESELEGSGDEQETSKPLDIIPTEDGEQFISVTTKGPIIEDHKQTTTEPSLHITTDEPYSYGTTTSKPAKEEIDKHTTGEVTAELKPHETYTTTSAEGITTESIESLNTVPDVIPEEDSTKSHKYAESTTTESIMKESESSTPTDETIKTISSEKEEDITISPVTSAFEHSTPSVTPAMTTVQEYSHDDKDVERTTSINMDKYSPKNEEEKESSTPEQYATSTISIPLEENVKPTSEPDHALNTVAVSEEEKTESYISVVTSGPSSVKEEIVTDNVVKDIEPTPNELIPTAATTLRESELNTEEPDKGLNTIPNEINEDSSSEPLFGTKTTEPSIITDKTQTEAVETKTTTIISETATFVPDHMITRGDQYTVTTEPSFRKEDEISVSTKKPTEFELTTVRPEFVDEGLIPTSTHDEKYGTSSDVPSVDEELTTLLPEFTKEIDETIGPKHTTSESILDVSVVTESIPTKNPEPSPDQESDLVSSTEKSIETTAFVAEDIETHEGPSRIPGEGDCLLNGVTYRNNTVVPSTNNCHTGCRCASSIIKCDPIICSPPPDYMDNCQSIYDSPDSCCPTYVCDHPRETVPPQSDNQMSGTEAPTPSPTIECRGDQCEITEPVKQPTVPSEPCTSGSCLTEGDHKPDLECGHEGCGDVPQKPDSSPSSEPCVGEHCEKDARPTSTSPICDNEEDCKSLDIPVVPVTPCEGESCKKVDCGSDGCDSNAILPSDHTPEVPCTDENNCKPQDIPIPECTGEGPCRRKQISASEEKVSSECQGSDCTFKTDTTIQDVDYTTTEKSISSQEVTEKVIDQEDKPAEIPDSQTSKAEVMETESTQKIQDLDSYTTESPSDAIMPDEDILREKPITDDAEIKKPTVIDEKLTEKSTPTYEEGTEKPGVIEQETTKKPDEDGEVKPTDSQEEVTEKPSKIDDDVKEKPSLIEQEVTDKPAVIDDEDKEKPTVIEEEVTDKPALIDDEGKGKPTEIDEEITDKPALIDEEDKGKPTLIEEEVTDIPALIDNEGKGKPTEIDEEITDKPALIDDEDKGKPTVIEEEVTDKPALIDDEGEGKPTEIDEEVTDKPTMIDDDGKEKPTLIEEEVTEKPVVPIDEDKGKPTEIDEEVTEKPTMIDDDGKGKPTLTEEEVTDKPTVTDNEDKGKPTLIEEETTDKLAPIDDDGRRKPIDIDEVVTEKPAAIDDEGKGKPIEIDEEVTEKSTIINEDSKGKPTLIEEEVTEKPTAIDDEGKEKPTEIDEEVTHKPALIGEEDKEKPTVIEEQVTDKPALIDDEGKGKPTEIDEDVTDKPALIADEDKGKPTVIEEEVTEKPALTDDEGKAKPTEIDEEITEKPTMIDDDGKGKPTLIEEEVTDKPALIDDEVEGKPTEIDEEVTDKPALINDENKGKPTLIEEEITDKPSVTDDEDKTKPTDIDEEVTLKPALTDEEDKGKPTLIEEEVTDKPALIDNEGKGKPTEIDEGVTDKLGLIDDEDKGKPTVIKEEVTHKPTLIDDEGKLKPTEIDEEITDKPTMIDDDGKGKPTLIEEEVTDKPAVTDDEGKTNPTVIDEEVTDKPTMIDDDGKGKPTLIEHEVTDKPVQIDDDGKGKPTIIEEETTDKPAQIDDDGRRKPTEIDEEITKKPAMIDDDGKGKPTLIEEEVTDQPAVIVDEGKGKPTEIDEEITDKPTMIDDDGKGKPTLIEEEVTEKPAVIDDEGKGKPTEINDDVSEKPTVIDDDGKAKPTLIEEEVTDKPAVIDDEGKVTPTVIGEMTDKPSLTDDEGKEKPTVIDQEVTEKSIVVEEDKIEPQTDIEEGSGTELPESHITQPEKEVHPSETSIQATDSTITDLGKVPQSPYYESSTITTEKVYDFSTETSAVGIQDHSIPESHVSVHTEPPEVKEALYNTEITTQFHSEQELTTKSYLATSPKEATTSDNEVEKETATEYANYGTTTVDIEAAPTTESPKSHSTTELEEMPTKVTKPEVIGEQEETFTDNPELEQLTTKISEDGSVIIEPQEGSDADQPKLPVTGAVEEEIATKAYGDKIKPEPESHITEDLMAVTPEYVGTSAVTESQEMTHVTEKDKSGQEETTTSISDITEHIHKGTTPKEGYTEDENAGTSQYTAKEDYSKSPEPPITEEYVTGMLESSTKSEGPTDIDTQTITTEGPRTSVKEEHAETMAPGVLSTESYDLGTKDHSVTEVEQEIFTKMPISIHDLHTEQPEEQVSSEIPQSLITRKQETPAGTTVSDMIKEEQDAALGTTPFQEMTKAPEMPVSTQEEVYTEAPISMKDKDQEIVKQTEKVPDEAVTDKQEIVTDKQETITTTQEELTEKPEVVTKLYEVSTDKPIEVVTKSQAEFSETTPYLIELEEHPHKVEVLPSEDVVTYTTVEDSSTSSSYEDTTSKIVESMSSKTPVDEERTTVRSEVESQISELTTKKTLDEETETETKETEVNIGPSEETPTEHVSEKAEKTEPVTDQVVDSEYTDDHKKYTTSAPTQGLEETTSFAVTPSIAPVSGHEIDVSTEKEITDTEKPGHLLHETSAPEDELIISTTKATTVRDGEEIPTSVSDDKTVKPEEKPIETSEVPPTSTAEVQKPDPTDMQPGDKIPDPEEEFPPSANTGYGEPDYVEEDQAFGPGTCRYGGKVYVSAQQIPRDDPCDFCFCFRSDIICLQQSCPPPIHGCHEEPIQGFCCPRYECPVSMATTVNVTTTTTTTTTTLPPHFPTHSYKGAAQRRGCQIKGHTYKVGEVVRSSSGPCLHCTCGGDGQMKCDPKACTPEPMLRQMIAAAVSAKRRR